MTGKRDIDPESFRGKVLLLAIDKMIIGAIIAMAFVFYDAYRKYDDRQYQARLTADARTYQDRAAEVQRDFERAKLAKEFLPNIFDEAENVTVRGYLLRSGVATRSIDSSTGVAISARLLESNLADDDFLTIVEPMLPEALPAVARRANTLALAHREVVAPSGRFLVPEYSAVQVEMELLERERWLWQQAVENAWAQDPENAAFEALDSTQFLASHLRGLYFILGQDEEQAKVNLSRAHAGFQLLGNLWRVKSGGGGPEASKYFQDRSEKCFESKAEMRFCGSMVEVLVDAFPRPGPSAAPILARVALADPIEIDSSDKVEMWRLQWSALEELRIMATEGPLVVRKDTIAAVEQDLLAALSRFRSRLSAVAADDQTAIKELSGAYETGKLLRLMVFTLSGDLSQAASKEMELIRDLGPDKLRAFPFLMEEVERVLEQSAANPPA